MTKPLRPCTRCGKRPKRPGGRFLCEACYGTCANCGASTIPAAGGGRRTHCPKCEIRQLTCSKCGEPRDGSHPCYCRACSNAYVLEWSRKNIERRNLSYLKKRLKQADRPRERSRRGDRRVRLPLGACGVRSLVAVGRSPPEDFIPRCGFPSRPRAAAPTPPARDRNPPGTGPAARRSTGEATEA